MSALQWQDTGMPTEPGRYLVDVGGWSPVWVQWSGQGRDFRNGPVRLNNVRGWLGPLPERPKPLYPERVRRTPVSSV